MIGPVAGLYLGASAWAAARSLWLCRRGRRLRRLVESLPPERARGVAAALLVNAASVRPRDEWRVCLEALEWNRAGITPESERPSPEEEPSPERDRENGIDKKLL